MKEINIGEATKLTSPDPLVMVCTEKEDGTTNLAPVSFVSYLSFNPAMIGFGMGKASHSGKRVRETKKVVLAVPSKEIAEQVMACGTTTGSKTDKVKEFNIELMDCPNTTVKAPKDSKVLFVATLDKFIEVGDHYFYACNIYGMYADESKEALFAWDGYAKVSPAKEQ